MMFIFGRALAKLAWQWLCAEGELRVPLVAGTAANGDTKFIFD
jgi:hypothetical protein